METGCGIPVFKEKGSKRKAYAMDEIHAWDQPVVYFPVPHRIDHYCSETFFTLMGSL